MTKLILDKETCIGCGSCVAVAGKLFKMSSDGKSELIGGQEKDGLMTLEMKELSDEAKEAIEVCPVNAIKSEE